MAWINPALLFGLGLVVVPIILHMMLRARPKPLVFPALQLIEMTRQQQTRRLQVRHLWLLLARMAVLALIVLAVARPTLPAADYRPTWGELLTLLAIAAGAAAVAWFLGRRPAPRAAKSTASATRKRPVWITAAVAILLALLLVGWPYQQRIAAAWSDPAMPVTDEMPVSAVFIFDTSSSMEYLQAGESRLDAARRMAREQIQEFPSGSRVAIDETGEQEAPLFVSDFASVEARMSQLEIRERTGRLPSRIRAALRAHQDDRESILNEGPTTGGDEPQDRFVREIYVFSDLAIAAWNVGDFREIRTLADELKNVGIYIVDVGVSSPANITLSELSLTAQQVPENGPVTIEAAVSRVGRLPNQQGLELILHSDDGTSRKYAGKSVDLASGGATVRFEVEQVPPPFLQGSVRLISGDPLAFDNELHFTVGIRDIPEVLVVSDRENEGVLWAEALSPAELRRTPFNRYRVRQITPGQVTPAALEQAAAVCLINVREPAAEMWRELESYVRRGGGLFVSLGTHELDPVAYQTEPARNVLPAVPAAYLSFRPSETLSPTTWGHPVLELFDRIQATGELTTIPFHRFWRVDPLGESQLVSPYSNDQRDAAVLSRTLGEGRVLMLTSAVDGSDWNDLPFSWAFVAVADQALKYLTQQDQTKLNFTMDEPVVLPRETPPLEGSGLLRKPDFEQIRIAPSGNLSAEVSRQVDVVGSYQLADAAAPAVPIAAFSVNPDPDESDLTPITSDDLNELFGEERYSMAKEIQSLERVVAAGRLGREMYPLLVYLLAGVFALELLMANRFYSAESLGQMEGNTPVLVNPLPAAPRS